MVETDVRATEALPVPVLGACDGAQHKSEWVLETLTKFGIVLGASFEGYEEELITILQFIKDRRKQNMTKDDAWKKMMKLGGKGSRELKNLVCTINYEAGSARKRGQREGGMPLSLCS